MGCWWFSSSLREVSLPLQRFSPHLRDILYHISSDRYMVEKEPDSGSAATKSLLTFYTQLLN